MLFPGIEHAHMGVMKSFHRSDVFSFTSKDYGNRGLIALENLPDYDDMFSKASDFDSLKQADVFRIIITNINPSYYLAREFKKRNNENSFGIFHTK